MNVRKFLSKNIIYRFFSDIYRKYKNREKKVSYGNEFPDLKYYIIGQDDMSCGLWWIVNKVVMHLAYADAHGYIPVVDYLNYKTQYHNPCEIGLINVWNKFFEQPAGLNLNDISKAKNIILSDHYPAPSADFLMGNTDFYTNEDRRMYFYNCFQKYIHFSSETYEYLENVTKSIIPTSCRVLGVLCRGTDYAIKKPKGHPIPPDPNIVIKDTIEIMEQQNCDYVFLATEDADILNMFKSKFKDKLLYIEQKRTSKSEMERYDKIMEANIQDRVDRYKMGLEYLSATYILSKCNCFIGVRCGGTKGVLLMRNDFEYMKIYDLGLY